jgi:predicted lactoylglutathione lyase
MIFVTLPVRDLPTARAFYEALDFGINEHSSDGHTAAVVVDDNIVVKLLTRDAFAELVPGEAADPSQATTVVNCLTVGARAEVDDLVAKAVASGGRSGPPARDDATTYTGSFTDPDGHVWQVMWMDQLHVVN